MGVTIAGLDILVKRIIWSVFLIVLAVGLYWCWLNGDWLIYHMQRQYDKEAYGLSWKVDISTAGEKARKEEKQLLIVFLKEGDITSDNLKRVLEQPSFKPVENNYVLLLVDYPADISKLSTREKTYCDELVKRYNIDKFGVLIVAEPLEGGQKEVRRIRYTREMPSSLLNQLAGGRFIAKPMVDSTPKRQPLKIPGLSAKPSANKR